jgi:4-amino-4-deoxy-L-arabinose transferase-like glycosyltransferase
MVILKIWKTLGYKHGWFTLFLWLTIPTVFWASYNNLLENTLMIFTSLSVLFYLKAEGKYKYIVIFLSGFMLSFGFLTKGFVAFFPWTFPFIIWLVKRKMSFGRMISESAGLFLSSVIPLLLLIFLIPVARISLETYINNQVIGSLRDVVAVDSRFYIVKRFLTDIAPEAVICLILVTWAHRRKSVNRITADNLSMAVVFFLICLTGVIPITISMKQSGFYVLPVYPLFAIGAAILINPYLNHFLEKTDYSSPAYRIFCVFASGLFIVSIVLSVSLSDGFSRDKDKIQDIKAMLPKLQAGSTININPANSDDWALHAYFGRYKNISLDWNIDTTREYFLIRNEDVTDTLNKGYRPLRLDTKSYQLLKRSLSGQLH